MYEERRKHLAHDVNLLFLRIFFLEMVPGVPDEGVEYRLKIFPFNFGKFKFFYWKFWRVQIKILGGGKIGEKKFFQLQKRIKIRKFSSQFSKSLHNVKFTSISHVEFHLLNIKKPRKKFLNSFIWHPSKNV